MSYKACTNSKCKSGGRLLPKTAFHCQKDKKSGLCSQCKECKNTKHRQYHEQSHNIYEVYYKQNKEKIKKARKLYRESNPQKIYECNKRYVKNNRARVIEVQRAYYQNNRAKIDNQKSIWRREQFKNNTPAALYMRLRARVSGALNGNSKSKPTLQLLGVDNIQIVYDFLEEKFIKGMSWKNKKDWHCDHIIPLSVFDLTESVHQKIAFHYTNLQPLWAEDNLSKGASVPENFDLSIYIKQKQIELNLGDL